jgi:hypothetical protein
LGGFVDLWGEFREYLKADRVVDDDEDAEAYMAIFFDRGYDMESLDDDLYNFAGFLYQQFKKMFGEKLVEGLWFFEEIDHSEYKYNGIKVIKQVKIGKYEYDVEVSYYDCKWGEVAEDPEDFNEEVESFLKETKEKLDNLLQSIK